MTGPGDYTACKLVVAARVPLLTAQIATELIKVPAREDEGIHSCSCFLAGAVISAYNRLRLPPPLRVRIEGWARD